MDEGAHKRNIENLIKLAQTISSEFTFKKKSILLFTDIYHAVKSSNLNGFVDEKEVRGWLADVSKIVTGWIEVTSVPGKTLIKLGKKLSDYEIGETIKMHYSSK
jgi:hypothetical protein